MKIFFILICQLLFLLILSQPLFAQDIKDTIDIENISLEEISNLTYDELLELPLVELKMLAKKFKFKSVKDLLRRTLNPDVKIASKEFEATFEAPLSTTVISKDEIFASGATTVPEVLRLVPGIIVRQKTNGNFDVHLRGLDNVPPGRYLFDSENTSTLVMIDNQPVYNNFQGGTFWETLPISINNIERIEIVRGPSSALYGSNAVSGVINIISIKPKNNGFHVSGNQQVGSFNTSLAGFSVDFGDNKFIQIKVSGNQEYRQRFQEDYLVFEDYSYQPFDSLDKYIGNKYNYIKSPKVAKESKAINACVTISPNDNYKFCLSSGLQKSDIQSVYIDYSPIALTFRESQTKYFNFGAKLKNFNVHIAYNGGTQNNAYGYYGYKFDIENIIANIDYLLKFDKLQIRPGISVNHSYYDDKKYLNAIYNQRNGIFNGKVQLICHALQLRADYHPIKSLRFVAALRTDFYDSPDKPYLSYQLIASYNFNNRSLFRFVCSRANRGPFMYDFNVNYRYQYTDYNSITGNRTFISEQIKNNDLKLVTMDLLEVGVRNKIMENVFTDVELFYSISDNYNTLRQSSSTTSFSDGSILYRDVRQKQNIEIETEQIGVTASVNAVFSKKMQVKLFGTYQKTKLFNYEQITENTTTGAPDTTLINIVNNYTPAFYGGFSLNLTPTRRVCLSFSGYYAHNQEFLSIDGITNIDAKAIFNLKINYSLWDKNSVFVNVRNLFDNSSKEFAFADDVRRLILVGINLKF